MRGEENMASIESRNEILLQPQGRLDEDGGTWLKQQIAMVAPRRYKLWLIDMSRVEFIDSAGLVALAQGLKTAAQAGAQLILFGLRPAARVIFEITQLDRVFTIFESYATLQHSLQTVPTLELA
jgi:anti-sigma B factor antagonist